MVHGEGAGKRRDMAGTSEDVQSNTRTGVRAGMATDPIQRLWDSLLLAMAGTHADEVGPTDRHHDASRNWVAPPNTRIRFEFYVTSESAEITTSFTTMRFKQWPKDKRAFEYFRRSIINQANSTYGVKDFRVLTEKEIDAFILGFHKHNSEPLPGEPNTSKGLPN